jgi:hypothetical protein
MTPLGTWLLGDGLLGGDYDIDERAEILPQAPTDIVLDEADSEALVDSEESEAGHT